DGAAGNSAHLVGEGVGRDAKCHSENRPRELSKAKRSTGPRVGPVGGSESIWRLSNLVGMSQAIGARTWSRLLWPLMASLSGPPASFGDYVHRTHVRFGNYQNYR